MPVPDAVLALEGQSGSTDTTTSNVSYVVRHRGIAGRFDLLSATDPHAADPLTGLTTVPLVISPAHLHAPDLRKDLDAAFLTPPRSRLPPALVNAAVSGGTSSTRRTTVDARSAFAIRLPPIAARATAAPTRCVLTGRAQGWALRSPSSIGTGGDASALTRAAAPASAFVRGRAGGVLFTPGGLDEDDNGAVGGESEDADPVRDAIARNRGAPLTAPPGMDRGAFFADHSDEYDHEVAELADLLGDVAIAAPAEGAGVDDDEMRLAAMLEAPEEQQDDTEADETDEEESTSGDADGVLDVDIDATVPQSTKAATKTDWAHEVTDPMRHFHTSVPTPAHVYPFELDVFQKQAVYHLECGDSVFVAAHTSAGKTVVAEYAIALARKHMTRAIYTSPIKALSNQKFRDFSKTFGEDDIGILTGDVQINPEAGCLIMTTEILRSMLYRGADLVRDIEYVIFDEVHYVNDADRGVVWEEVIIMLPPHVQLILLSATVPNTKEFADWVGRTKKRDIYVISTQYRPVPLEHHLYVPSARNFFKVVDSKKNWIPAGLKTATDHVMGIAHQIATGKLLPNGKPAPGTVVASSRGGRGGGRGGGASGGSTIGKHNTRQFLDKTTWTQLVGTLGKKGLLPVTVFVFSKRKCEEYADCLESTDLLSASEKSDVHVFVERAVSRLRPEDRHLPQLQRMREMLRRGIAVHHSGVLPLVKEMVEILFGRGLVKVLFATETFAMGVNMPTKCVVFASIRKHDGIEFRNLLPGEYTQMSGRAGRRGLDETGTVLMMLTDLPDQESLKTMLLGAPTKLASQFRLTYNMIVNLLRVETLKVEEMMKRSFSENASQKMVPAAEREYMATQRALDSQPPLACVLCTRDLDQLYDVSRQLHTVAASVSALAAAHPVGARAVATGRLVVVSSRHYTNALGVVLSRAKSADAAAAGAAVTVLVLVDRGHKHNTGDILATGTAGTAAAVAAAAAEEDAPPPLPHSHLMIPAADRADGRLVMVAARDLAVVLASTLPNVKLEAVAQRNKYETRVAVQLLREYAVANADALPEYSWSKIRDLDFAEKWLQKQQLEKRARQFQCLHCPDLAVHYHQIHKTRSLSDKLVALRRQLSAQNLELLPEYHQRMAVLEQLGYVDPRSRTVQLKGRVACEINSCDELLLTELILDNFFADLDVAETAAVISVFLFQEKAQADGDFASAMLSADAREAGADGELPEDKTDEPIGPATTGIASRWPPRLVQALRTVHLTARRVVGVQADMGVPVSVENYLKSNLRYGLVDVVYEWARGMPFLQIMSMTEVLEGSIVRCIVRIEESCREIKDAARLVGDGALYQKMDAASIAVKRDIVFCGSLYI